MTKKGNRGLPFVRCLDDGCEWSGKTYNLVFAPDSYRDACPKCYSEELEYFGFTEGVTISTPLPCEGASASGSVMAMPKKKEPPANNYRYGGYGVGEPQYERCYMKHKPLSLGGELKIWGGSCLHPKKKNADIYIGFDRGMSYTEKSYPWLGGGEFLYPIRDQAAPDNTESFKSMVEWTAGQIQDGKEVHAGCIGGHGRTGLFFAALVAYMGVSKNAIEYVRKNYCDRAVESDAQVKFLEKHFDVGKPKSSKKKKKKKATAKKAKQTAPAVDLDVLVGPLPEWDKPTGDI